MSVSVKLIHMPLATHTADKLEPASGDPSEFLRLFFDITFFFFVIVILLAIMQGKGKGNGGRREGEGKGKRERGGGEGHGVCNQLLEYVCSFLS